MEKSKKRTIFSQFTLLMILSGAMLFTSCDKSENEVITDPETTVKTTGFYVVNEGQYGKSKGSLTLYNYGDNEIQTSDLAFGETTCYGARFGKNLYFVSKQDKRLVVVDEASMTEIASMTDIPDGRAFAVVNDETGVMTTTNGAYTINLKDYTKKVILEKSEKQCGAIYVYENHVFIINSVKGILVYDAKQDFKLVKELGMASVGFARSKNGLLWAANGTELVRIDPVSLSKMRVSLPTGVKINDSWGAWNCGSLTASRQENVLYFAKSGAYGGGKEIYRYEIGNEESLLKPFIKSTVEDDAFYGSAINVDPTTGDIVATFCKDGWGDSFSDNRLVIFDHKTGNEIKRINHVGYKFPGTIIFKYEK